MKNQGRLIELKDISFQQPLPLPHMEPLGLMPNSTEACALWMFLVCAFQALDKVESQVTYEDSQDQVVDIKQIAESIRKMYGLKDLEGMFNVGLLSRARREAIRSGLSWNSRIDAWFESGGRAYNKMDRDPDKVGQ